MEQTEFMLGKVTNRIGSFPLDSIRSSGTRRLSPSGRWLKRRPATCRFAPFPTINSVLYIAVELRRPSPRIDAVQIEIRL
jgi:hypothetical protein